MATSQNIGIWSGRHNASVQQFDLGSSSTSATSVTESIINSGQDERSLISVSAAEYQSLLKSANEYNTLRKALVAGGIETEILDVLIRESAPQSSHESVRSVEEPPKKPKLAAAVPMSRVTRPYFDTDSTAEDSEDEHRVRTVQQHQQQIPQTLSVPFSESEKIEDAVDSAKLQEDFRFEDDYNDRSLVISGLARFTTLADVLKVVRGGKVLLVYIRPYERSAYLSFFDSASAEKFVMFAKRAKLHILDKPVEVFWDERQRRLPAYISQQAFYGGATRNLVVRFVSPQVTADSIRDDLEHIHHLEVVSITFDSGHAFISTNSISHALIARSCMRSRFKYNGTRIDFYADECDEPLPDTSNVWYRRPDKIIRQTPSIAHFNRFAPLIASVEAE